MENLSIDGIADLKRFLEEAELQHYFDLFRNILKVTKLSQLKYVATEDLIQIGLSKPEQRRYKKLYNKYFPNPYLLKIKKLLNPNKQNDVYLSEQSSISADFILFNESNVKVSTKHIIPMEDITINKELGMGQFGVVQQGTWTNGDQRLQVAIKCLGNEKMTSNSTEFLKEAAVMHSIEHPNIVRLYGVVLHLDSLMLHFVGCPAKACGMFHYLTIITQVTELAPLRSLLECLREVSLRTDFTVPTLCDFAEQISDGMSYLENKRLIHRDLAARNILVFRKNRVKISDFGLSRALGVGKDYYQTNYNVNLKLPVAWCAPECILYLRFTSASDVWAFGVCLWEMFTYGFQPWAAFSGQQILEAIDAPNYQRLERPDCCPEAYYNVMLECWSHDLNDRPKFKDIGPKLREIHPEQVQATSSFDKQEQFRRTNFLDYKTGQIITVLGKEAMTTSSMWYGVLPGGACGLFDPAQTVPHVKKNKSVPLASSTVPTRMNSPRPSLMRTDLKRHTYTGKRTINRDMISKPQGDVKHTGHIGLDGAYFGDISFLDPAGCPPRQVVTPYKPSEDLDQIPLINPHSPSHLSGASCTPPYALLSAEASQNAAACDEGAHCEELTRNKFQPSHSESRTNKNFLNKVKSLSLCRHPKYDGKDVAGKPEEPHEYHEISETDTVTNVEHMKTDNIALPENSKYSSDFSQSLINEMEFLFRNHIRHSEENAAFKTHEGGHRSNISNKTDKKKNFHTDSVKPMSAHDEKTLETAVALANEISIRSMSEIDNDKKAQNSPSERTKFHFKFPVVSLHHRSHSHDAEKDGTDDKHEKRNFSEEARSVPDIQSTITEESKLAYTSLIEEPTPSSSLISHIAKDIHLPNTMPKTARTQLTSREYKSHLNSLPKQLLPTAELRVKQTNAAMEPIGNNVNLLPLPPKSTKPKLIEKPRHVRKYPLKLPTNSYIESDATGSSKLPNIYQNTVPPSTLKPQEKNVETITSADNGVDEPIQQKEDMNPFINSSEVASEVASANPFECHIGDDIDGPKSSGNTLAENIVKDHVSVEDLLEFADQKPRGRQRGVESDEVRIMCKVLKEQVTLEDCLEALELSDWNVHQAIKLMKVKISVEGAVSLDTCYRQLVHAKGDIVKASAMLLLGKDKL